MAQDELTMRAGLELACWSVAIAGCGLLTLACAAEMLRRRNRSHVLVALSDRLLPTSAHRVAVAIVTVLSSLLAIAGPRTALADAHVRDWLTGPTTSTTLAPAVPTPPRHETEPVDAPADSSPVRDWLTAPESEPRPPDAITTTTTPTVTRRPSTPGPGAVTPVASPPSSPAPPDASPGAAGVGEVAPTPASSYAVAPGDCLWSIAARRLGPGATNRSIDRGWRAIYAANQPTIGPDPNLIFPGLVLTLPPLDTTP